MHPIMSDIDVSVRQFERTMERDAFQQRLLTADLARQRGLPGMGMRLVHAVWQFLDPRGFALHQVRQAELRQGTNGSRQITPVAPSAQIHTFPAIISHDREQSWRNAA